ncbi:MAG: hypothetical protein QM564_12005 [Bergeyella sp.]
MKKFSLLILLGTGVFYYSQNTYIDLTTTLAMKMAADKLENAQEETIEQQTKLQKAQAFVATQMAVANEIQNKVLKGLSEVSGTVTNGVQVMNIYNDINRSLIYAGEVTELVKDKPQYSVFGIKASERVYKTGVELTTEVSELLQPGVLNLATAGDRNKLLFAVHEKVKMLQLWIYGIKYNLERAIRLGFWKSINPFQGYINTDKSIVENILQKYKHSF